MISQLDIGSVSFNTGNNYFLSETNGLEMLQMRVVNYNLAGEHFGIFVSSFYGKRRFNLKGWVVGSTVNEYISKRDDLQKALDIISGKEQTLKFTLANGRQIQIDAVCIGLDFTQKAGEVVGAQFFASFDASFPFLVSQTENSQNITLSTGGGGKVPPDTMPMALGGDSGGNITLVNNGNGIYYPTVRFSGPVTNPQITNETLEKYIRLQVTLVSGEYIDLDFKRKTITDNLGTNKYSTKSGDWWYVQPGSNVIRFTADVYNASSLSNIKYRDSYLGI